ncbi:MAG: TRAP transporter small permease [Pseudomonadota bacterium]
MIVRICKAIDHICDASGALTAFYIAALATLAMVEIICRNILSYSIPFATEYAGYLVILSMLTGLGWAMKEGAHIQVLLLHSRIPQRFRPHTDMATSILGFIVSGFFAAALWRFGLTTWTQGTVSYFPSQTPLAYPQLLMAIGPTTLCLACLARILRLHSGGRAQEEQAL